MLLCAPLLQEACGELEGADLRLAKSVGLELLAAGDVREGALNNLPQGAHTQARVLVASGPDNVVVTKVDWR